MKDLKHLIYFENLLQEANNELVQRAISDGKKRLRIPAIISRKFCSMSIIVFR